MNQDIAQIALMFVLPLGITFITILKTASSQELYQKVIGFIISLLMIAMDFSFYFVKNTFIIYNNDGGLLLGFICLFFYSILCILRSEETTERVCNIFLMLLMLTGFVGMLYLDRPIFFLTRHFSAEEIQEANYKYKDYISSFQEDEDKPAAAVSGSQDKQAALAKDKERLSIAGGAKARFEKYVEDANTIIGRMDAIVDAINKFELMPEDISDADREEISRKALAISNNAANISKKAAGLFRTRETAEAHAELTQAGDCIQLAGFSLYNYTLKDNAYEQKKQFEQASSQIVQYKTHVANFRKAIQDIITNKQQQPEN